MTASDSLRILDDDTTCESKRVKGLYALWDGLRGDSDLPPFTSFDYLDCEIFLPRMAVLRIREDGEHVVDFIGSDYVTLRGVESTGLTVNENLADREEDPEWRVYIDSLRDTIDTCARVRKPVAHGPKFMTARSKNHIRFESITVPFADADGRVSHLVSVMDVLVHDGLRSTDDLSDLKTAKAWPGPDNKAGPARDRARQSLSKMPQRPTMSGFML